MIFCQINNTSIPGLNKIATSAKTAILLSQKCIIQFYIDLALFHGMMTIFEYKSKGLPRKATLFKLNTK